MQSDYIKHGVTFLGMHSDSGDEGGREAGR